MRPMEEDATARRAAAERALAIALERFEGARDRPIVRSIDPTALHRALDAPLPRGPTAIDDVLDDVERVILPACRENGHPRMFGYVSSSAAFTGVVADAVASAANQNVTSHRSAPGATEVERVVVRWLGEIVGYPADAGGLLTSGGSMANLVAMAAALRAAAGPAWNRRGVRALDREPVTYAPVTAHFSVAKAAEILGLGRDAVRAVPVDRDLRLDVAALDALVDADVAAGRLPFAVVANAGDVNAGVVDPLHAVADLAARRRLWFHADGAYGALARLAPSARDALDGIDRAASVTLDPHKWMFAPVDAGAVLVRDAAALPAAFSHEADYVRVLEAGERERFAFWDYGPELSRRFRALKVWMILRRHGADGVGAAIDENVRLARVLARLVREDSELELLAEPTLSIVCFRVVPARLARDARALDELNARIVARVQRGGEAYVSNATLKGAFWIRACIVNYRTTEADLSLLLDVVRRAAAERSEAHGRA